MEIELIKHNVCTQCHSIGITDNSCICTYGDYKTVELEFEACKCCGNILNDGQCADTEFNAKQLSK